MADAAVDGLLQRFAEGLLSPEVNPAELFRGTAGLDAARFALYRGNLTANWERSLGNAYPVLRQLVGEEFFRALAREYGRQTPSTDGDLNRYGADFATFLEGFTETAAYPYFPDVARLEWAVHRAYYAADLVPLTAEDLSRLGATGLEEVPFRLRPGTVLVSSPWAIAAIWLAHQEPPGGALPAELARPSLALVYRPEWRVQVREIGPGEGAALGRLLDTAPLAAALEAGLDSDPQFDPGAALQAWLAQGLIATLPPDKELP